MKQKLLLTLLFSVLLSTTTVYSEETPVSTAEKLSIQNEFISIVVNNKDALGRFALETTLGSPSTDTDDYQDLIYGKPIPWTSYTTFYIDEKAYIFGSPDKRLKRRSKQSFNYLPITEQFISGNAILSRAELDALLIEQELSFFRNPNTNVNDSVLIQYRVQNNSSTSTHSIGSRIMLDTKLGSNDGAPLRMGTEAVFNEVKVEGDALYDYWQAFDSLISPNIIAQGILSDLKKTLSPPDSIHLANWGTLVDSPWNADYQKGRAFIRTGESQNDTALALHYDPRIVSSNQSITIKTAYGLGGISLSPGELSAGLTTPKQIASTNTEPFLIMGYILNAGDYNSYNTKASFSIPNEFEIVNGDTTVSYNSLSKNEQKQLPLLLKLNSNIAKRVPITLSVESDTFESTSITRYIDILAPPKMTLAAPSSLAIPAGVDHIIVPISLYNPSALPIRDITISLDSNASLAPFETTQKTITELAPYENRSLSWALNTESLPQISSLSFVAYSKTANSSKKTSTLTKDRPQGPKLLSIHSQDRRSSGDLLTLSLSPELLNKEKAYSLIFNDQVYRYVRCSLSPEASISLNSKKSDDIHSQLSLDSSVIKDSQTVLFHFKKIIDLPATFQIKHQSDTVLSFPVE